MTKRESQKADYESERRIIGHAIEDSTPIGNGEHRVTVQLLSETKVNTMSCTLTPQLENAWSRAGILFGLLNAKIGSGYLVMVKDTEAVEFEWRVKVGRDWLAFSYFVNLETLGQVGVSLVGLSATIVEHWDLRLGQLIAQRKESHDVRQDQNPT